jgi:hypothetical protein
MQRLVKSPIRIPVLNSSSELVVHPGSSFGDLARAIMRYSLKCGDTLVEDKRGVLAVWIRKCARCAFNSMYAIYPEAALIPDEASGWMVCLLDTARLVPSGEMFESRLQMARDNSLLFSPLCLECSDSDLEYDDPELEGPGIVATFHVS